MPSQMGNKEVLKHGGLFLYARNVFRLLSRKPEKDIPVRLVVLVYA